MILRVASKKLEGGGRREQYDLLNFFEEVNYKKEQKSWKFFLFLDLHTEQCTCSAYDLKYKKGGCVV